MQTVMNPPTVQRLIALLGAGYSIRVQESCENRNALSLEHPANWKRIKEKSLLLDEEGDVFGINGHEDGTHLLIYASDNEAFQRLIAATPKPTWWELNNGPFHVFLAWVIIIGFMSVFYLLISIVVDFLRPFWS